MMQPSETHLSTLDKVTIKVVHKNYKGKICYKCGTALSPRTSLAGRYYCPTCPEGEGEYISTHEFYRHLFADVPNSLETTTKGTMQLVIEQRLRSLHQLGGSRR